MILKIVSGTVPVAKPRMTRRDKWEQRPCVVQYWTFKDALVADALSQGYRQDLDVYRIDAVVHIPMPKSWSKARKQAHDCQPHRQKPDADNILKGICDALLEDDSGVWDKSIRKYWGYEGDLDIRVYYNGKEIISNGK